LYYKLKKFKKKEFLAHLVVGEKINLDISETKESFLDKDNEIAGHHLTFIFKYNNKQIILKSKVYFNNRYGNMSGDFVELKNDFSERQLDLLIKVLDMLYWEWEEIRWKSKGWKKFK